MQTVNVLIFGSTGTLGLACNERCKQKGWRVYEGFRQIDAQQWGVSFDGVIWSQGINFTSSFEETTDDDWLSVFDANLFFIVKTLRSLLEHNAINEGSSLVVIGSVWEKIHRSNKSAYSTSKAAVSGLVRALSSDLAPKNMRINCVSPGIVLSPMTSKHLSEKQIEDIERNTPGGKLVSPMEIAKIVEFLISKDSSGINGQSIFVDHGWSERHNV
jgi:3-oxoacyl-[acyl-carrier protein] reductase